MANKVLDIENLLQPESLASHVSNQFQEWQSLRRKKLEEWKELRNYIFATDTSTTSNNRLPWSNSTTTPKLTQIRDNLHANYFAALFPNRKWMKWDADTEEGAVAQKRSYIQAYMENKTRQGDFTATVSKLVDDYILYGNAFGFVDYESNYNTVGGEVIPGYIGPRLHRISPNDIVFNPIAETFEKTPKIIRTIKSLGEMKKEDPELFMRIMDNREQVRRTSSDHSFNKAEAYIADGFTSISSYYGTDYVECLTFYGDLYDRETQELKENRIIKVIDRAYVLSDEEEESWLGSPPIFHVGWRERPDNLYAMGPLDNLVGMQYRIDHLENLKADIFDQIALGMIIVQGEVEDFTIQPGEKIYVGDEGSVRYLVPDTTALNADFQISALEDKMEEMAGAPRQAMGIRTPGEKTAFEVSSLQNAANRIFQHKAAHFERTFLEKILNAMLEQGRRNIDNVDKIRVLDDTTGAQLFLSITKEDITAKGKIIPIGARHFAERSQRIQELNNLIQIKGMDPSVGTHLSGKMIAKILTEELGESALYEENIAILEQMESMKMQQEAQVQMEEQQQVAMEQGI